MKVNPFILQPFGEAQGRLSSQETAFLFIYINGKDNNSGGMKAIKRAPNSSHALCFLPTPFGQRANILLRTNGLTFICRRSMHSGLR